jgi:2-polyprenyl-3-methyl-5-hydroxy-6-metoxy-1,4-benzoquinol methylase
MVPFFQEKYTRLVDSPNKSPVWWHSMPLPDGSRISGIAADKDLQFKMWRAMRIDDDGGLRGKRVLDIGANDGFFTLSAAMAGASEVTAIDKDWSTWPQNIHFASQAWRVAPQIVTADFRSWEFRKRFDAILFLGILYHLEDVFTCMKTLSDLLEDKGVIYIETQMSQIKSSLPIFEYASDTYPTIAKQDKNNLSSTGISNYLFPNERAIRNLAYSYDFVCEDLNGPHNIYSKENPGRQVFRFSKVAHETQ